MRSMQAMASLLDELIVACGDPDRPASQCPIIEGLGHAARPATATMRIELLHAPGCKRCARASEGLRAVAERLVGDALDWRELDVTQHLDYAVQLGVLSPPALAIDGQLAFPMLPSPEALEGDLKRRMAAGATES